MAPVTEYRKDSKKVVTNNAMRCKFFVKIGKSWGIREKRVFLKGIRGAEWGLTRSPSPGLPPGGGCGPRPPG